MRQPDFLRLLAPVLAAAVAVSASAQVPEVGVGECLYLVGAPAGAPEAETEERLSGSEVDAACNQFHGVELNRDGDNMVQAWIRADPAVALIERSCRVEGWAGHQFAVAAPDGEWVNAVVTVTGYMSGEWLGVWTSADGDTRARVGVRLVEEPNGLRTGLTEGLALERSVHLGTPLGVDAPFSIRLESVLRGGSVYAAESWLLLDAGTRLGSLDFGETDASRHVRYTSIEVCTWPATGGTDSDWNTLEAELLEARCPVGLWLPQASGGRLEDARDRLALRLAQAESVAPAGRRSGVQPEAARRRLAEADALIADGEHPAACRSLSHGMRALAAP